MLYQDGFLRLIFDETYLGHLVGTIWILAPGLEYDKHLDLPFFFHVIKSRLLLRPLATPPAFLCHPCSTPAKETVLKGSKI